MADTSWAERRGRMLKCKTHGLHYDPEMSTGCTLCLRDAAKAQPVRPPQLVLILLCLLGMAAILFYVFAPSQDDETPVVDLGVASNPAATNIDAEPFRATVESLETALFRTPVDRTEDLLLVSGDIQTATSDLSAAILQAQPVNGLTAADMIARMGQALPHDQIVIGDIQQARRQWLRIRRQRFLPAPWFVDPKTAIAEAEAATSATSDYSDIAASLGNLIEDAGAEADALSIPGDEDPVVRWRNFTRDWLEELNRLESRLPARPGARAAPALLVAIQDLERALRQARALASSSQPPTATDNRFDDAINAALRAQQAFDDLGD